jgi:carbonic anhydrase
MGQGAQELTLGRMTSVARAGRTVLLAAVTFAGSVPARPARADHWGYAGKEGPGAWGKQAPTCSTGKAQSPINIATKGKAAAHVEALPRLEFGWKKTQGTAVNNGHTVEVQVEPGSTLTVGDTRYELVGFHFHTPSEHEIDGKRAPMEVHFVHRTADGKLGVVGLMITHGKQANPALAPVLGKLPANAGEKVPVEVDLPALVPDNLSYFTYQGSLTTPPCSEGVHWMMLETPLPGTPEQIASFHSLFGANARPLQPLNERDVALQRE